MLKFIHTADWQVGRIYSQFEEDDASALSEARFKSVERIAQLASQHAVDAVLVAGDVFDLQTVSDKTIRRLFLSMEPFEGPWILIPGNHDAALTESVWSRAQRLNVIPPNVQVCLQAQPVPVKGKAIVLPAPLQQRHTYADLTEWFVQAPTQPGLIRVGLAHGSMQGVLAEDIDSNNPIASGRAASAKLDYLALGDWHGTKQIDVRTWYSGTPETDRFKANESGQVLMVSIQAPGVEPLVESITVGEFNWVQLHATVSVPSDVDRVITQLQSLSVSHVVQLRIDGIIDLAGHKRLLMAIDSAGARVRALTVALDDLALEPTDDDIAQLKAEGYVGEVLHDLREQQHSAQSETVRDALLILAGILDPMGNQPANQGGRV